MKKLKSIVTFLLITFIFSLLFDRVLGLLGFPETVEVQHAYNPNHRKKIKNIEFAYDFVTNSQGIRYKELPLAKPEYERRVFLLGDSFTVGISVESSQTFGVLLEEAISEKRSQDFRFINGGLGGKGPLHYWRIFSNVGLRYNLDGVLICIYANDVSNMPQSIATALHPENYGMRKRLYTLYPRGYVLFDKALKRIKHKVMNSVNLVTLVSLRARQQGIPKSRIEQWKQNLPKDLVNAADRGEFTKAILSHGLLRSSYWTDALDINTETAERKYKSYIFALEQIKSEANIRGIEVAIVYIPSVLQYDASSHDLSNPMIQSGMHTRKDWLSGQTEVQRRLQQWTDENQLPFLDLTPVFRRATEKNSPLTWDLDEHWNPIGHQVASTAIENWLERESIFSFTQ